MLTIAELNEIRTRVRQHLSVRKNENDVRVIISSGTTAIAAGARQLMAAALEEIAEHGATNVHISQRELDVETSDQPAVVIAANGSEVLHKRCTPDKLRLLIRSFLSSIAVSF